MSTLPTGSPLHQLSGPTSADAPPPVLLPYQAEWVADAAQLKVAEKAVDAYAQLAQKNNTMIVPGNMGEVSALIGTAMALIKGSTPGGGSSSR
jgi:hypothetical protein